MDAGSQASSLVLQDFARCRFVRFSAPSSLFVSDSAPAIVTRYKQLLLGLFFFFHFLLLFFSSLKVHLFVVGDVPQRVLFILVAYGSVKLERIVASSVVMNLIWKIDSFLV